MNDFQIAGESVAPGETRDLKIKISETYTGDEIYLPLRVIRSSEDGPTLFVTAAVHGDEINGTGIVHDLMFGDALKLTSGTLILVPVVNIFGFENHERYLPDRRDLNRSFPGSEDGSMASRIAFIVMTEIIKKSDYGIDLHSAAFQRTNYPNVRGDFRDKGVRRLVRHFATSLNVDGRGPDGALRREACKAGVPTIILEAGEPWKIEPTVMKVGVQGILNVLIGLGMMEGAIQKPAYSARIQKTIWMRAEVGGILRFQVNPGDIVDKGEVVATNYSIMGAVQNELKAPEDGIVLSLATMPAVKPGEPVCHLAMPTKSLASIRRALAKAPKRGLYRKVAKDLASSVSPA